MPKIRTHGGEFSTDAPGYYTVRPDNRGARIKLVFTPGSLVECPKIGLVQTATTQKNGAEYNVGGAERQQEQRNRSLTSDEEQEQGISGRHIDRTAERTNPVYGMNNAPDGSTSLGSSSAQGNAHWGKRVRKNDGTHETDPAWLTDGPSLNAAGVTSTQQFETTALCVEGDMSGTYLGSVRWGYTKDTSDVITLIPLSLVSMGVPTTSWMRAARKWNSTTTNVGGTEESNLQLPVTNHQNERVCYTGPGLARRIWQLREQLGRMNERDDPTTYRNIRFELRALEQQQQEQQQGGVAPAVGGN